MKKALPYVLLAISLFGVANLLYGMRYHHGPNVLVGGGLMIVSAFIAARHAGD